MTERRCLTIAEYAAERKVSLRTVRRWVALGLIPVHREGPRLLRIWVSTKVTQGDTECQPIPKSA